MNDKEIHGHIEQLVAEEHALFEKGGKLTPDERKRLGELNVQLDRYYDLLRQRRAREEFDQDPEQAKLRSSNTVESYLQ